MFCKYFFCMEMKYNLLVKVLYVGPYSTNAKGGVSSVIENYLRHFQNLAVFSTQPFSYNSLNHFIFPLLVIRFVFELHKGQYQIVHIHGASYGSFFRKSVLICVAKWFSSAKIVYHIHGGEFKLFYERSGSWLKLLIIKTLRRTDYVVCLSVIWENFFKDVFKLKKVGIVNNIVPYPENEFKKSIMEKSNKKVHFLFLGRISEKKGVFDLLNVIKQHRSYLSERIELVVGGNGEVQKLKKFIANNQLEDIVKYAGWVKGADKAKLLSESHVFILPSYHEGLPVSILEAMSYGLAVVSTPVGGIPEIVGNNGLLIEPGNLSELFDAIDYCINNDLSFMSENSSNGVGGFYPQSVYCQLTEIYREVIEE